MQTCRVPNLSGILLLLCDSDFLIRNLSKQYKITYNRTPTKEKLFNIFNIKFTIVPFYQNKYPK